MSWQTVIEFRTLEQGRVGEKMDLPDLVEVHETPEKAMLRLNSLINHNAGNKAHPEVKYLHPCYFIRTPYGQELSLNSLYEKTFGENPINTPRGFKYPLLKRSNVKNIA